MSDVKKIYQAIPKIMSKIGAIEKTRTNTQGATYKFRGIDDVYFALQPLLVEFGIFFIPSVIESVREERQSKAGGNLIYTVLTVKYTFYAEDGSNVEAIVSGEAMDSGDKSCNKAMSAALKVAALQIFCVPVEEDKDKNDTEYHSPEVLPKPVIRANAPGPVVGGRKPSEAQLKRLFSIASASQWNQEAVRAFISAKYGITSTSDLTIEQYNEICDLMPKVKFDDAIVFVDQDNAAAKHFK